MKSLVVAGVALLAAQNVVGLPVIVSYSSGAVSNNLANDVALPQASLAALSKLNFTTTTQSAPLGHKRRTFIIISTSQTVYPPLSALLNQVSTWWSQKTPRPHATNATAPATPTKHADSHDAQLAQTLMSVHKGANGSPTKRHIRVIEVTVTYRTVLVQLVTLGLLAATTLLFICVWFRCSFTCFPQENGDLDIEFLVDDKENEAEEGMVVVESCKAAEVHKLRQTIDKAIKASGGHPKQKSSIMFV